MEMNSELNKIDLFSGTHLNCLFGPHKNIDDIKDMIFPRADRSESMHNEEQ